MDKPGEWRDQLDQVVERTSAAQPIATLTIIFPETNDSGNYQVIVTNYAGSVTSSVAMLTVTNIPTVFTQQPASQTVGVGSTVTNSVLTRRCSNLPYSSMAERRDKPDEWRTASVAQPTASR